MTSANRKSATLHLWVAAALLLAAMQSAGAIDATPPTLTVPATSTGSYTVSWSGLPNASEYTYTLQENTSGSWVTVLSAGHSVSKSFTKTSSGARSYRVKECVTLPPGDGGTGTPQCSDYSTARSVEVYIQPGAPAIGGADYRDSNGNYIVAWSAAPGTVTSYRLFEKRDAAAWTLVATLPATTLQYAFSGKADANYRYQVDGCNTLGGECGGDSNIRLISVDYTPPSRPSTAVVLGDSFSSGEGGRWAGNSFTGIDSGDRAQTDSAAVSVVGGWEYDLSIPYHSSSIDNGCNRSNWAPITYLEHQIGYPEGFEEVVNLACSGARTKNLWPVERGGVPFKGESPQIPRLAAVNTGHDIDLIVIGIGGNDMGFSDIIMECGLAWIRKHWTFQDDSACDDEIVNEFLPNLGTVWFNLMKTIDEVKKQMATLDDSDYQIVLTGYPAIIPDFYDWAYSADMRRIRNCPFNGPDSAFIEATLMPKLNATVEAVADQEGVDFINLHHAFDGHRLCEAGLGTRMVESNTPTSHNTEWVRYLDTTGPNPDALEQLFDEWKLRVNGTLEVSDFDEIDLFHILGDQGTLMESLHPNMFGQQAMGDCLREYREDATSSTDLLACRNAGSGHASDMRTDPMPSSARIDATTNAPIPDVGSLSVSRTVASADEPARVMRNEIRIQHAKKGQLRITIRSPSNKIYVVKELNGQDGGPFPSVWKNFYHEAPAEVGTWTLKIEDSVAGVTGTFDEWKARFY